MTRYLEKPISRGNLIDLVGQLFYQLGYVKQNEVISNIEISDGKNGYACDDPFYIRLSIEKELEVKLIEHHGKRLYEGSSMGGQTGTGETP